MQLRAHLIAAAIFTVLGLTSPADAHTPFAMALRKHYDLRSVTCFACHKKGNDEATGKPYGREHHNELGKALEELLREKNLTEQIEAAKDLDAAARKRANELATEEFLKAWKQIENEKNSNERTWREQIQAGEHEGITLKPKK